MTTLSFTPLLHNRIRAVTRGDEDAAQAVALKLLELAAADPTFGQQAEGFHIRRAKWEASHHRERAWTYDRFVACEPYSLDPEDGEIVNWFDEYVAADALRPEDELIEREVVAAIHAAIDSLPTVQRQVVRLLAAGFDQTEICRKLNLSKSSCSHAVARARTALSAALPN